MFGPPDTEILRSVAPEDQAEEAIARYMERYRRDHGDYVTLFDGFRQLIEDAASRGIKLAVVTGQWPVGRKR